MTNILPLPFATLVPMNTVFLRSERLLWALVVSGFFSAGKSSPVIIAWLTKRPFDSMTMPSPGIRLPTERRTTSPGTISSIGMDCSRPSRITLHCTETLLCNFSTALLALYSSKKPKTALRKTMVNIIAESAKLCTTAETTVAKRRIMIIGLLNWERKMEKAEKRFLASSRLRPTNFRRSRASDSDSPLAILAPNTFASASTGIVQYSASSSFQDPSVFIYVNLPSFGIV